MKAEGVTFLTLPDSEVMKLRTAAVESLNALMAKDPKYTAPAGNLMKEFLRQKGFDIK